MGIVSKFTPARSPQSNGMTEALVKTLKRDYVFCNDRSDAETVMAQLPGWFEDYNENAPHKALRMLSPREFIRSLQEAGVRFSRGNSSSKPKDNRHTNAFFVPGPVDLLR